MDIIERKNIIKKLKERIELFKHYNENEEKDTLEIKNNLEYITWIEYFTEQVTLFGESYVSNLKYKELLDTDKINMKKIRLLYNIVREYANCNYICPIYYSDNNYYLIRYNDIVYEIGIGTKLNGYTYYCKRLGRFNIEDAIEFKDIMEDKITERSKRIKIALISLNNILEDYSENIPLEVICKQVNDTLEELKVKRKVR